jgi:hypothetical protein
MAGTEVLFYDATGQLTNVAGRRGAGPGEFNGIVSLVSLPNDSVLVVEVDGRATVLGPDRIVHRLFQLGAGIRDIVRMQTGAFAAAVEDRTTGGAGFPLRFINGDGTVRARFGTTRRILDPRIAFGNERRITTDGQTIWSVPLSTYRLERWNHTGSRIGAIVRDVPWFEPRESVGNPNFAEAALPTVIDIAYDARRQHLWVAIAVADPTWRSPLSDQSRMSVVDVSNQYWDTLIEVIDIPNASVVGTARIAEFGIRFAAPGELVIQRDIGSGFEAVQVLRFAPPLEAR